MDSTLTTNDSASRPRGARLAAYLALAYLLLIVYASLTPFSGWRDSGADVWSFLFGPWSRHIRRFDVIINLLAYMPFGFLLCLALQSRCTIRSALIAATLAGLATSLVLEEVQMYLPTRTSSTLDVLTNGLGCLTGAVIAARAGGRRFIAVHLARLRDRWFIPGVLGDLGLVLLGMWFISQLNPSLPLLGIVPFSDSSALARGFSMLGSLSVMCNLIGVGLLSMLLLRSAKAAVAATLALILAASLIKLVAAAVLLKPEALLQWLTAESVTGIGYGLFAVAAALLLSRRGVVLLSTFTLVIGIIISHLHPNDAHSAPALRLFSWHYGHLLNFTGLARIVAELWPFLVLAYLYILVKRRSA
jgi:VanZ family protein